LGLETLALDVDTHIAGVGDEADLSGLVLSTLYARGDISSQKEKVHIML
jgi:hypothetical protein